ncbi:unnamed protein product [Symbiodinium natans]|uniref:Uncharacterized protein n=1 Tax=Symbiodinium natans TaxID=878477 RepID=A0A812KR04_9DINO|nr:unnamed protein product [Symbiodinium natans]
MCLAVGCQEVASWTEARPSADHCLGDGAYFAARRKAERFGFDFGHGEPAVVRCSITVHNPYYSTGDNKDWRTRGHDSCRATRTSLSSNPEWCVLANSANIRVLEVIDLRGQTRPAN